MRERTAEDSTRTTLRLLATSDVHMHLTGWDPRTDETLTDRGFDRIAGVIQRARATAPGPVVLMDNGDGLQGAPHGETAQNMDGPHPWPALLNATGYDVLGLGNHDFDYGLAALERFGAATEAPVLSASLDRTLPNVLPHLILERALPDVDDPLRIGVTSVLPPQTLIWAHAQLQGQVGFRPGVAATLEAVTALRDAGADVVIVLCHSGLSGTSAQDDENFARALARDVPGIDAMILGHTHERFPDPALGTLDGVDATAGTIYGVPAAMPGFAAALLAQIDLRLTRTHARWTVDGHDVRLLSPDPAVRDTDATRLATPCLAATRLRMQEVVGHTDHAFHSYFAMLKSNTADAIFAEAMRDVVRQAVVGTAEADMPLLAATAPYAAGGRAGPRNYLVVDRGDILARHIALISPFENTVSAHHMTGADIRAYLETSLHFFAPDAKQESMLVAAGAPAFNFDTLNGLHMQVDPFAPRGARVVALTHDAKAVAPDDCFLVAMTSYRGAGGGGFPGTGGPAAVETHVPVLAALRNYLASHPVGAEQAGSVWSFAASASTPVVIETSPRAAAHLDEITGFAPIPLGVSDAGFLQVRVTL